jgi:hypothetical protein
MPFGSVGRKPLDAGGRKSITLELTFRRHLKCSIGRGIAEPSERLSQKPLGASENASLIR